MTRETLHRCRKTPWGQKSRDNESSSSQKPSFRDSSWLRVHVPMRIWKQIHQGGNGRWGWVLETKQNDWPEGRQKPRKLPPHERFKLPRVRFLGREDPLEKEMNTHSSILDWRISWTEEPGGLQSMGSQESDCLGD